MPKRRVAIAASLVLLNVVFHAAADEPLTTTYRPFPPGFDYPLASKTLHQWVSQNQWPRIREHGWNLFAGMHGEQTSPHQIWETWYSLPQTFASDTSATTVTSSEKSKRSLHSKHTASAGSHGIQGAPVYKSSCDFAGKVSGPNGPEFLNNEDIMIAGVYYNREAYQFIHGKQYSQKTAETGSIQDLRVAGRKHIKPFPATSISIKHMYWPVRQDGLTALPVAPHYNPAPDPSNASLPVIPNNPAVYNGYETWGKAVAIAPTPAIRKAVGRTSDVTYLYINDAKYPPVTFKQVPVVPLEKFYYRQIGSVELNNMDENDRCILNQSAKWAYNREFRPNDYIVSIAMHIVTKELPYWTTQSFWWSPEPGFGRYARDRSQKIADGAWKNYMMCTAYDMVNPKEGDGTPAVCSNPYIELVIPETYRSVTNCQNCHIRAAYPAAKVLTDVDSKDAHYNSERRGEISYDDKIFDGLISTDFSWSLPLSAPASLK